MLTFTLDKGLITLAILRIANCLIIEGLRAGKCNGGLVAQPMLAGDVNCLKQSRAIWRPAIITVAGPDALGVERAINGEGIIWVPECALQHTTEGSTLQYYHGVFVAIVFVHQLNQTGITMVFILNDVVGIIIRDSHFSSSCWHKQHVYCFIL